MQPIDKQQVEDFICDQGWEYREVGEEFQILSGCPLCQDPGPNHFYINQNKDGAFHCFKCSERGNLVTLRQKLGVSGMTQKPLENVAGVDSKRLVTNHSRSELKKPPVIQNQEGVTEEKVQKFEEALWRDNKNKILEWLRTVRGFRDDTIKKWRLGWDGNRIVIPIFQNGELVTLRYRQNPLIEVDGAKYLSHPGSNIVLFNQDCLEKKVAGTCIVEGEFDAMILMQEWGNDSVVSSTGGCNSWIDEWTSKFKEIRRISIIFDNDAAGIEGANKISKKLGWFKCYNVCIPKKNGDKKIDITDFLVRDTHSFKELQTLISAANRFPEVTEERITPIRDILPIAREHIIHGKTIRGVITGYEFLDTMIEGFRPGDMIVLSGKAGTGKTLISQAFALNIAKKKQDVMFFSLEMLPSEIVQRFIALDSNVNMSRFANVVHNSTLTDDDNHDINISISRLENYPLYFYTGDDKLNFDLLSKVATTAVEKYNAQLVIIDHLHYFARGDAHTRTVEIGDLARQIKLLARRLNIPILLIAHLKKVGDFSVEPDIDDLRDSSFIGQDADVVMFVMRDKLADTNEMDPSGVKKKYMVDLLVAKNRHGLEGKEKFFFQENNMLLKHISELAHPNA